MNNIQRARWCFTLNSYDDNTNYEVYLSDPVHDIKRAVVGFEVSPSTERLHLQGYLEMKRSYRIGHMKKIFANGYWFPSTHTPYENYKHCVKQHRFIVVGNFASEQMRLELIIRLFTDTSLSTIQDPASVAKQVIMFTDAPHPPIVPNNNCVAQPIGNFLRLLIKDENYLNKSVL